MSDLIVRDWREPLCSSLHDCVGIDSDFGFCRQYPICCGNYASCTSGCNCDIGVDPLCFLSWSTLRSNFRRQPHSGQGICEYNGGRHFRKNGEIVTFAEFMKIGVPFTLTAATVGMLSGLYTARRLIYLKNQPRVEQRDLLNEANLKPSVYWGVRVNAICRCVLLVTYFFFS